MSVAEDDASDGPGTRGRLVAAWERFFFANASPAALGLFRILFAYCLFREVETTRSKSVLAIEGGYHIPYLELIPQLSEQAYAWMHDWQYPLIVLLGLGAFTRTSCVGLILLQGWIFLADEMVFRNHPYFFLLVLILLLVSPARDSLSLRALRPCLSTRRFSLESLLGPASPLTMQRLLQLQVCIVYVYAAIHKLHPYYLEGHLLARLMAHDMLQRPLGALLGQKLGTEALSAPENMAMPAMLVVAIELSIPIALWFRRTRPWAIAIGTAFHASIGILMNITVFSTAMIATYLLFLDPGTVRAALLAAGRRLHLARPAPAAS